MKLLTNLIFEPKGMHDPALAYSIKDTVMSPDGSRVYFALQDVPAGTPLSNEACWKLQIDLSACKNAMDAALASFTDSAGQLRGKLRGETAVAAGNPVTILPDACSLLTPVTLLTPQQPGSGDPSAGSDNLLTAQPTIGTANQTLLDFGSDRSFKSITFALDLIGATVGSDAAVLNFQAEDGTNNYITNARLGVEKGVSYTERKSITLENITFRRVISHIRSNAYAVWSGQVANATLSVPANLRPISGWNRLTLTHSLADGTIAVDLTQALGQTVYSGCMNWRTGRLTVDWGCIDSYAGEALPGEWISDRDPYAPGTTPSAGAQVVYRLAQPVETEFTPQLFTAADPEQENSFSGDGTIEVEYVKPLHVSIDERIAAALGQ